GQCAPVLSPGAAGPRGKSWRPGAGNGLVRRRRAADPVRGGGQAVCDGPARQPGAAEPGTVVAPGPQAGAMALGRGRGGPPGGGAVAPLGVPARGDCRGGPVGYPGASTGGGTGFQPVSGGGGPMGRPGASTDRPGIRLWGIPGHDRPGRRGDGRDG